MLQSQFDALEEPTTDEKDVFIVDIEQSLSKVIADTEALIRKVCQC